MDYEEIELAAKKSESEFSFEDDALEQPNAIPTNNSSEFFDFFFREEARRAFLKRGKQTSLKKEIC